jgi:predicted NBD/HSP70 family sugar kinase
LTVRSRCRLSNLDDMPTQGKDTGPLPSHGARLLPSVEVDSYNLEIEDEEGFVGDRASKSSFAAILDKWRKPLRKLGDDPLGEKPSDEISKKKLDSHLTEGDIDAAVVVHSAVEDFAQQLASVIRRFLKSKGWRDTECVAVGGGFRNSRVGELAIGRAAMLLKAEELKVGLEPIHHHPDEAGLIGALHLMPSWMIEAHDGIIAVDIGGTNIRAGVVASNLKKTADLAKAEVWKSELWRHANDDPKRDEAVQRLIDMVEDLIARAVKAKIRVAPVIGIVCPGVIKEDGSIEDGAQNLPGNWESNRFNLAETIRAAIPTIGDHETAVIIHNDAVVQGLSELPFMGDFDRWGILTIGTGLGNACFTNRSKPSQKHGD